MRKFSLFFVLGCMVSFMQAQINNVSIQDVQTVSQANLSSCIETSSFLDDTVQVRGVVIMDGGLAQIASGRNVWIQAGNGPFGGIDLLSFSATSPTDMPNLQAGDSIEVVGVVDEFFGESEIFPTTVTVLSSSNAVNYATVNVGALNDSTRTNILTTGEQWEGQYVEIQNVTVTSVDFFSGGSRVSFVVEDATGNQLNVSDRFLVQRLPANGGSFVPPSVGTVYSALRGIITHSGNGCLGSGRGYEMQPFQASDYVAQASQIPPVVSNVERNTITPTSSQVTNISAQITDADGTISSATLYYSVGVTNTNYQAALMVNTGGNTYLGTIPTQADGSFVKYYVCATDNDGLSTCSPDLAGGDNPHFFTVRDNGTTVYDVQFTPYSDGNSGYVGDTVTVTGIVTASQEPDNLGYVHIQQPFQLGWSGLSLIGDASLATLEMGDWISVTGVVEENFGFTRLDVTSSVTVLDSGYIVLARELDPSLFSVYDFAVNEMYEGMLVKMANPTIGNNIYVVDNNADDPSNFAEYRIGNDPLNPTDGCRVLAGRQTGSAFSSLNVSYVNDSTWATSSGTMNVPVEVVQTADSLNAMAGIMFYSFGNFKLLPRNNADVEGYNMPAPSCEYDRYEPNDSVADAVELPKTGIFSGAYICLGNDLDWFYFDYDASKPYVRIVLDGLAADFSLELYNDAGVPLGFSYNAGTSREVIVNNGLSAGRYYILVYSANSTPVLDNGYNLFIHRRATPFSGAFPQSRNTTRDEDETSNPSVLSTDFHFYPNPASDELQVYLPENANISLRNHLGQQLMSFAKETGNHSLNLSDFPAGIYWLEVQTTSEKINRKLVIR